MATTQLNLSEPMVQDFQRDGAICLHGVFDEHWLAAVTAGIERNLVAVSPGGEFLAGEGSQGRFFNDYCNWRNIPEFTDYVLHSPAAEIAARLMRSDQAIFYHEHVLVKEPGALKPSPWHHDQPYYPVEGTQLCSIWMPIDPVPVETTLKFVRGSHAWGRWFVPRKFATALNYERKAQAADMSRYEQVPDIEGDPDKYEILAWPLEPGDCVVFHGATLHGAAGNTSLATSRRVLATRWFGDDARFTERPWDISPPVTGGLRPGDPMACAEFPIVWSRT